MDSKPETTNNSINSMKRLLKEMATERLLINRNLDEIPAVARSGWVAAQRAAQGRFETLKKEYQSKLLSKLAAIVVSGPQQLQEQFALKFKEHSPAPALFLSADELYRTLANGFASQMRTDRAFTPSDFANFQRATAKLCNQLDLPEMPDLQFKGGLRLGTFDDVVNYVRETVRAACGDSLNRVFMTRSLVEQALEGNYTEEAVTLAVVLGTTKDEAVSLAPFFNNNVIETEAPETVTHKKVIETLKTLRAKLQ